MATLLLGEGIKLLQGTIYTLFLSSGEQTLSKLLMGKLENLLEHHSEVSN